MKDDNIDVDMLINKEKKNLFSINSVADIKQISMKSTETAKAIFLFVTLFIYQTPSTIIS